MANKSYILTYLLKFAAFNAVTLNILIFLYFQGAVLIKSRICEVCGSFEEPWSTFRHIAASCTGFGMQIFIFMIYYWPDCKAIPADGVMMSVCPSVRLSVRLSVCPSTFG